MKVAAMMTTGTPQSKMALVRRRFVALSHRSDGFSMKVKFITLSVASWAVGCKTVTCVTLCSVIITCRVSSY